MHPHHDIFIAAIHSRQRVALHFYSKEDGGALLIRSCAPMDYGPSRRAKVPVNRYHFWDYDSDSTTHTLSIVAAQVDRIVAAAIAFEPDEFVTWPPRWFVARDWGKHS